MPVVEPVLLRLWDVVVACAPTSTAFLLGSAIWTVLARRFRELRGPRTAVSFCVGATLLQALTWTAALFSGALAATLHWLVLLGGVAMLVLLVSPDALLQRFRLEAPTGVAKLSALGAIVCGFLFANATAGIPSDAIAYHIPIARWFGEGSSWAWLPNHLWTSQLPLASSLWSSYSMGAHVPVTDPMFAWSAQTFCMQVWTAGLVYDVVTHAAIAGPYRFIAAALSLALVLGHYPTYSTEGFVDWTLGAFLVAYAGLILCLPANALGLALGIAAGGAVGEFRPQGLLFCLSMLIPWAIAHLPELGRDIWSSPAKGLAVATATLFAARWWILVWWRWGTPFVPLFAARLKLDPLTVNANVVYRTKWPPAGPLEALRSVFAPPGRDALITATCWLAVVIASLFVGERRPRSQAGAGGVLGLVAVPVLVIVFLAQQSPTQWVRMAAPAIPLLFAGASVLAAAQEDRTAGGVPGMSGLIVTIAVVLAAVTGSGILALKRAAFGAYPTEAGIFFKTVYRQLEELGPRDALILEQYGAALLPKGYRQHGGLYPPWSSLPRQRLDTREDWLSWFRQCRISAVVGSGPSGKQWIRHPSLPEPPNFRSLDEWMASCVGRRTLAHWVRCPVPAAPEGN